MQLFFWRTAFSKHAARQVNKRATRSLVVKFGKRSGILVHTPCRSTCSSTSRLSCGRSLPLEPTKTHLNVPVYLLNSIKNRSGLDKSASKTKIHSQTTKWRLTLVSTCSNTGASTEEFTYIFGRFAFVPVCVISERRAVYPDKSILFCSILQPDPVRRILEYNS